MVTSSIGRFAGIGGFEEGRKILCPDGTNRPYLRRCVERPRSGAASVGAVAGGSRSHGAGGSSLLSLDAQPDPIPCCEKMLYLQESSLTWVRSAAATSERDQPSGGGSAAADARRGGPRHRPPPTLCGSSMCFLPCQMTRV
eukprot:1501387-Rhodomonas_salina.2